MRIIAMIILNALIVFLLSTIVFGATIISPTEDQQVDAGSWITIIVKPDPGEEWVNFIVGFEPLEYVPDSQVYKRSIQVPKEVLGYRNDLRVYGLDKAGNEIWLTRKIFVKLPPNVVLKAIVVDDYRTLFKLPPDSSPEDKQRIETRPLRAQGMYSDGVKRKLNFQPQAQPTQAVMRQ